jgi:hypothetical protein
VANLLLCVLGLTGCGSGNRWTDDHGNEARLHIRHSEPFLRCAGVRFETVSQDQTQYGIQVDFEGQDCLGKAPADTALKFWLVTVFRQERKVVGRQWVRSEQCPRARLKLFWPYAQLQVPAGAATLTAEVYGLWSRDTLGTRLRAHEPLYEFDLTYTQPPVRAYQLTLHRYVLDTEKFDPTTFDVAVHPFGSGYPDPYATVYLGDAVVARTRAHTNKLADTLNHTTPVFRLAQSDRILVSLKDFDQTSKDDPLADITLSVSQFRQSPTLPDTFRFSMVQPLVLSLTPVDTRQ